MADQERGVRVDVHTSTITSKVVWDTMLQTLVGSCFDGTRPLDLKLDWGESVGGTGGDTFRYPKVVATLVMAYPALWRNVPVGDPQRVSEIRVYHYDFGTVYPDNVAEFDAIWSRSQKFYSQMRKAALQRDMKQQGLGASYRYRYIWKDDSSVTPWYDSVEELAEAWTGSGDAQMQRQPLLGEEDCDGVL